VSSPLFRTAAVTSLLPNPTGRRSAGPHYGPCSTCTLQHSKPGALGVPSGPAALAPCSTQKLQRWVCPQVLQHLHPAALTLERSKPGALGEPSGPAVLAPCSTWCASPCGLCSTRCARPGRKRIGPWTAPSPWSPARLGTCTRCGCHSASPLDQTAGRSRGLAGRCPS